MKNVNESSMLVAQALDKIRSYISIIEHDPELYEAISLLEQALEKLVVGMV